MQSKNVNKIKSFAENLNRVEHFHKAYSCKMFKVRQGSYATDRHGVQNNRDNKIFDDYFFFSAERNQQPRKEFFDMNDSVMIKEMNFFWLLRRGVIQ